MSSSSPPGAFIRVNIPDFPARLASILFLFNLDFVELNSYVYVERQGMVV